MNPVFEIGDTLLGTTFFSVLVTLKGGGATIVVLGMGFLLGICPEEWCWLVLAITVVWVSEALNTAFEFLANVVSPTFDPQVKQAKDVAAGAVLIATLGAILIGLLVFGPYVLQLIRSIFASIRIHP